MEKIEVQQDRRDWVMPQVEELDAGAAESSTGQVKDGGQGFQGS